MPSSALRLSLAIATWALSAHAMSCDINTGERKQSVFLDWNHSVHQDWDIDPGKIKSIELPNGFHLGLRIEPAEPSAYEKPSQHLAYVPEMVKISVYDMGGKEPRLLTFTYGGANSIQGYGDKGGADRVVGLGTPGITLTLLKPVCANLSTSRAAR